MKESKNVIFHGAPGTGKTFLAKMVAADIVSNGATTDLTTLSPDLQSHIGFVQFHPSYDYTDFVEGLRPVDGDNGQINIRWQPGVFYKFINAAREQKSNPEATFDASWDRLLELIDSKGFIIVPNALRGEFGVELNITGDGLATRTYQSEYGQGEWLSGKGRFYSHNQMYRVYRGLPGVPAGGHDNYRKAILNYMIDHVGLIPYNKLDSASQASYVFIIDEINRGELGKIFGELFYSIDPGYRGKKGTVQTQYANLHPKDTPEFYVPENVYIIGTMNDIDRSVDTFDFAMRRRFRFLNIDPKDCSSMLGELKEKTAEANMRMNRLNKAIIEHPELNENYQIGPAYFLELATLSPEQLWQDYLEPLLKEYLRGTVDEDQAIERFHEAYEGVASEN